MKGPKPRVKKVFEKVLENHGRGIGKAMLSEGYTEATAKNPLNITETKSWEMLCDEFLPNNLILDTHKEAFTANRTVSAMNTSRDADSKTNDFIDVPDWQTRMKAVELGYKVKGRLIDRLGGENGEPIKVDVTTMLDKAYGTSK